MRDASKWSWLVENLSWMACAAVLPIGCATQGVPATSPTVEEQNQAIARRWSEELWGQGRLATADEIIAPDYVRHDPGDPFPARGPADVKRIVAMLRGMLPDFHIEVDAIIADGDFVVSRYTA